MRMGMRSRGILVWAGLTIGAATLFGGGCGDVETSAEELPVVSSALSTANFTDGSGTVKIRIKTCDWTPSKTANCAYCAVDSGWVRIGGGGEIEGSPSSARLKASLPSNNPSPPSDGICTGNGSGGTRSAWIARSAGATSHRLRAYVIGLQLVGLSEADLQANVFVHENTTGTTDLQPTMTVPTLAGSLLISGGAEIVPPLGFSSSDPAGGNGFLTESRPLEATNEWKGTAIYTNPINGGLKVYSIGINGCPTGWNDCFQWKWRTATTGPTTGYGSASAATPYPWVTASVGALGVSNGSSSRYLADLIPFAGTGQGFTVRTKDQGTSVSGSTTGYALNLMKGGYGLWQFNSIRFNTPGTALSRPSGVAPVTLQQSNGNPDVAARRWHLESLGSGQYRVRHGNPQQGTECAFRQSGTSSVRVGPCGSGNEFRWTQQMDPNGTFKLRNVAVGQCMDNNNQGATTSNVVLRTCLSAYSDVQSLFLDHYSWPP